METFSNSIHNSSIDQKIKQIIKLSVLYPNDQEFGKKIRECLAEITVSEIPEYIDNSHEKGY